MTQYCTRLLAQPAQFVFTLLCLCVLEVKEEAERAQAKYHSEKQRRKQLELRVNNMEEELLDLKADKESLERVSMLYLFVLSVKRSVEKQVFKGKNDLDVFWK